MKDILQQIVRDKRLEVDELQGALPLERLQTQISPRSERPFHDALSQTGTINIIAELKQGSPSKGLLVDSFNPALWARQYRDGGAAALSVLTDQKYFYGRPEYMGMAKREANLPILCKDFVINRYQIYYARYMQADAILLIVRLLTPKLLVEYLNVADTVGLDCLVETHNAEEVNKAVDCGANIIGVNNRNLHDFSISLETSEKLARLIPEDVIKVTESGIATKEDVSRLKEVGFNCFLIGGALMTASDPVAHLRSLRKQ
ncbi:MAG: indole-3-glycerol phosphate synthase TrpC [candidate division Zixibacteria bacterium]|nr:indole-3-glycerol phosphate synthase TrpC [candidate division Zixibacteria bacterium]